jgi:NitT/TauT family transport system substrate-binding protein
MGDATRETTIDVARDGEMTGREDRMTVRYWLAAAAALAATAFPSGLAAETLKIASPIRGSWEGAIPELGKQAGIFQKHGLDLEILYTQGGGETMQVVVSGSVDVGLSAGTLGSLGAYAKGAPLRIIGASSTGSREVFWWVPAKSPLQSMRDVNGHTIAYSTTGASSHVAVLHFINEYGLKAKPVATGDAAGTITQTMSGQVDVGWAVAPFVLDRLDKGEARMIARASDIAVIRGQTIRVQIINAQNLAAKKDAIARYMKAYNETVEWMYAGTDAVPRYIAFSGLSEPAVRLMLKDFIPKESLQTGKITGIQESMKDAVQFKFIPAPLTDAQLAELIQIVPVR